MKINNTQKVENSIHSSVLDSILEKIQGMKNIGIGNKNEIVLNLSDVDQNDLERFAEGIKKKLATLQVNINEWEERLPVLISTLIEKAIATAFKEKCKGIASNGVGSDGEKIVSKITEIDINLNRILEDKGEQIKDEVKKYIESNRKATEDQLKQNLEVLRIENQKIFNYGEEILSVANKILESITNIEIAGKENINAFKKMIKDYFDLAEKRHQELVGIITKETGVTLSGNLDNNTILEMFNAIKQIKESAEKPNKDLDFKEYNKKILTIIQEQSKEIKTKLKDIKIYAEEILSVDKETLLVAKENSRRLDETKNTLGDMNESLEKVKAVLSDLNEKNDYICLTKQQRIEMENTIKELKEQIEILQDKLEASRRSGTQSFTPCPYCGVVPEEGRILSAEGTATCSTCGRPFMDMDPTQDENITNKVLEWRKKHTVELSRANVEDGYGYYLYFPTVEIDNSKFQTRVSHNNIVIIPDKDTNGNKIEKISFCTVNSTRNRGAIEEFKKATLIFVKDGIEIIDRDPNRPPFKAIWKLKQNDNAPYKIAWYKWNSQDEIATKKTEINDQQ